MLQFTITGNFEDGDALELAQAWGYQTEVTVEELPEVWNNIPNPVTPENYVLETMKKMCADKIADYYKQKAFKVKEAVFLAEIEVQNSYIVNNIEQNITAQVVPVTP